MKEDNEILLEDDEEVEKEADGTWSEDLVDENVATKEVCNQKLVNKLNKINKLKDDKLENLTDRLSNCSLTPVLKKS